MVDSRIQHLLATSERPVAVIAPLNHNGVLCARGLRAEGVNVIGIFGEGGGALCYTNSCRKVFCRDVNGSGFIDALNELAQTAKRKPVLLPVGDLQVLQMSEHRELLSERFSFNIPSRETIAVMMDKANFYSWGYQHFPFPKTYVVRSEQDVENAIQEIQFPVVLKPKYRSEAWLNSDLPKAPLFDDALQLRAFYRKAKDLEGVFIVSEYVAGPDSNIVVSHFYYADGDALAMYVDRKIRQQPPLLGTGCYCVSFQNPRVVELTRSILQRAHYAGAGSMEFKKDQNTGEYKVIEPCCGRPSSHTCVCLGEGYNLPYLIYCHLAGKEIPQYVQSNETVGYMHEEPDLSSTLHYIRQGELSLIDYLRSLMIVRVCVHLSPRDPLVSLIFLIGFAKRVVWFFAKKTGTLVAQCFGRVKR